jgi:dihydroorotate dehydrogenase (NAD+) catalytic subunit
VTDVAPSTASGHRLTTDLAGLAMPSPVMTAAGCGGRELAAYTDLSALGALVTRTVTLDTRAGAPPPRIVETPSGVVSAVGLQNPGLQGFLTTDLPWFAQQKVRTVVSVSAASLAEYGELARRLATAPGVDAVEVHLEVSDAHQTGKAVHVVRRDLPHGMPVLAKLAAGGDVASLARAAVDNGADAVVVTQGFPALVIDPVTLRPALGAGPGLLTGPAVHALALRCVWDVHEALPHVPIVGAGGIRTGFDALTMLLAGATAVQLGTVLLRDPSAAVRVTRELADELASRDLKSAADAVGLAHQQRDGSSR